MIVVAGGAAPGDHRRRPSPIVSSASSRPGPTGAGAVAEVALDLGVLGAGSTSSPSACAARGPAASRKAGGQPPGGSVISRGVPPVLRHDADLLRQRRAAHRHGVHDGHGRRPGALAPPARRRRVLPHRHRRARPEGAAGGGGQRAHPASSRPTATSARFREAWESLDITNDDFIRTTEPRHHQAVAKLMQAAYDNGWIELGTYGACTACPARRTTSRPTWSTATSARSTPPRRAAGGGQLLLQAVRLHRAAARVVRGQPDGGDPRVQAQRGPRPHPRRAQDVSISRTSIDWGVPVPWDDDHVFYVWYDALDQLRHGGRLRLRPGAFRDLVARRPPPDRQGHPPVPLRLLAGAVHGRRDRPARPDRRARVPARRRREDVQDGPQPDRPRRSDPRRSASTASATTSCATRPSGPTATSPTRGWWPATTPIWPTTSATSSTGWRLSSPASAAGSVRPRIRPAPWRRGGRRLHDGGRRLGADRPERGARGHLAPRPGDQRRPGGGRAVEGRARAGGRRRARRRPRGAADPGRPGQPGHPPGGGRDLAPHRPRRLAARRPVCPTRRRGAATPAARRS